MYSDEALFVLLFIAAATGLWMMERWFNPDRRIKSALRGVPVSKIRDVADGQIARITGSVKCAKPVQSPFSGLRCAWYSVVIEESKDRNRSGGWQEIRRLESSADFYVHDETGRALVRTEGALMAMRRVVHESAKRIDPFLAHHGVKTRGVLFHKQQRVIESRIDLGERVTVGGRGRREPDPESAETGYRELGTRLVLEVAGTMALLITDDPEV